jgi:hypothetical protein
MASELAGIAPLSESEVTIRAPSQRSSPANVEALAFLGYFAQTTHYHSSTDVRSSICPLLSSVVLIDKFPTPHTHRDYACLLKNRAAPGGD